MDAASGRWREVSRPVHQAEAAGLDHIRRRLPDAPPYHAWSNLTFRAYDGSLPEVDLLVIGPAKIYLIELKMWRRVGGNDQRWFLDGSARTVDNPVLLANKKAKRLKTVLERAAERSGAPVRIPFVEPVVFLHNPGLVCELDERGRVGVYGSDDGHGHGLPAIVSGLLTKPATKAAHVIDERESDRLAALLDGLGFLPGMQKSTIGSVVVDDRQPYAEGPGWQDYLGHEVSSTSLRRRVRIFRVSYGASAEERRTVSRAAQREMHLMQGIVHPGVARPLSMVDLDPDTALIYEHDRGRQRFDHYLAERHGSLTISQRVALIRQLAEALRFAHHHSLYHRALSPACVEVRKPGAQPQLVVTDWQTGGRDEAGVTGSVSLLAGTRHLGYLVDELASVYHAPELAGNPASIGPVADMFSLGAVSFTILSGRPPAASQPELLQLLHRAGGLRPDAEGSVDEALRELVFDATRARVSDRLADVEQFLARLDDVARAAADTARSVDPLDADRGAVLDGRYRVERRLDRGSTARGLLVSLVDEPSAEPVVLKVALNHQKDARLDAEARVLGELDNRRIVKLLPGPRYVGRRRTLVLEYCGDDTLRERLRQDRLHIDQVARFGHDLLKIAAQLEKRGVWHRDIKPDNLGVRIHPGDQKPHLVLYDFSMAHVPAANIHAGTPPYLDPFLGSEDRSRYDQHAERFAVAVTLYEMATGSPPRWGDGSHPGAVDVEVTVESELIDSAVREALTALFRTALARRVHQRFAGVAEMAKAWRAAFESGTETTPVAAVDHDVHDRGGGNKIAGENRRRIADVEAAAERATKAVPARVPVASPPASSTRKLRVYEIAKDLGLTSREVLAKLAEMGEFVRSASSTVEPLVVQKLYAVVGTPPAPAPEGGMLQAPPVAEPESAEPSSTSSKEVVESTPEVDETQSEDRTVEEQTRVDQLEKEKPQAAVTPSVLPVPEPVTRLAPTLPKGKDTMLLTSDRVSAESVMFNAGGSTLLCVGTRAGTIWHTPSWSEADTRGRVRLSECAAFSADGTLLAGGDDHTVRIWETTTWEEKATLTGHGGTIRSVAFSPDGTLLASGDDADTIKIWRTDSWEETTSLPGYIGEVWSMVFSPDGRWLVTLINTGLKIWGTSDWTQEWTEGWEEIGIDPGDEVFCVAFSPDCSLLACGRTNGEVALVCTETRQLIASLGRHQDMINFLAFSPDGILVASASDDRTIKLWHVTTGALVTTFTGHREVVNSVAFSPDGTLLASASKDKTFRLWRVPPFEPEDTAPQVPATTPEPDIGIRPAEKNTTAIRPGRIRMPLRTNRPTKFVLAIGGSFALVAILVIGLLIARSW